MVLNEIQNIPKLNKIDNSTDDITHIINASIQKAIQPLLITTREQILNIDSIKNSVHNLKNQQSTDRKNLERSIQSNIRDQRATRQISHINYEKVTRGSIFADQRAKSKTINDIKGNCYGNSYQEHPVLFHAECIHRSDTSNIFNFITNEAYKIDGNTNALSKKIRAISKLKLVKWNSIDYGNAFSFLSDTYFENFTSLPQFSNYEIAALSYTVFKSDLKEKIMAAVIRACRKYVKAELENRILTNERYTVYKLTTKTLKLSIFYEIATAVQPIQPIFKMPIFDPEKGTELNEYFIEILGLTQLIKRGSVIEPPVQADIAEALQSLLRES